jgi:hypothetical protein
MNFLLGSASSSSSSSSSSTTNSLVEKLNKKKIVSCILAMSKINLNKISKDFAHAALLLIDTDSDVDDDSRGDGILIEYGDYSPNMSEDEKESVKKGRVIYRYGDKGGLRYYAFNYKEYLEVFGDICYVSMDIEPSNQITFQYFLETIAPPDENNWIKEKYKVVGGLMGIGGGNHNCQVFAAKALDLLKPSFLSKMIVVKDKDRKTKKKIDIFPVYIKEALSKLGK